MRVQAVDVVGAARTWTVLGDDHRCVDPIEEFLEYHRVVGSSPKTVRSYAKGLELWWSFLAEAELSWEDPGVQTLRAFLTWLATGLSPAVVPLGRSEPSPKVAEATVSARLAAVVSFYRYHHDVHGRGAAIARVSARPARRGRYRSMLAHLDDRRRRPSSPLRLRRARSGPPPLLSPAQVAAILDGCATFDTATGEWRGSLRDRLLFATLVETGARLGEVLCLTHADWHVGRRDTPLVAVVPKDHPHGMRVKGGGHRRIYVSDSLERLYSDYLWALVEAAEEAGRVVDDDSFVFVNLAREPRFAPMRPENVYATVRRLRRQLGDAVPEGWQPHWTRHTHATALLLAGVPLHVVSRRLGHADVQTTIDLYGWVTEDAEMRAAAEWRRFAEGWRLDND
ncbi:MAG: tyrosine-type recombinase/integrase [Acidimicrobiales bacterium]